MNVFWLLTLAHLIADFPLQTDTIYYYKNNYSWGVLPHTFICMCTSVLLTLPYLWLKSLWVAILILAGIHALLDTAKVILIQRYLKDNLFLFIFEQSLHLSTIWIISFVIFDFSSVPPHLGGIHGNERLIISLSGIIFSMFGGAPIIHYLRLFFSKPNPEGKVTFPPIQTRILGYLERSISTLAMILGGWFYLGIPLAFLPRFLFQGKREERNLLLVNLGGGLAISIGVGMAVRRLT